MNSVSKAINDAVLRRMAGDRSYQRGHDYYKHGHVESLDNDGDVIRAVVCGTEDYTVTLSSDEGVLDYACSCPQGRESAFCKHCVAAALAWLNRETGPAKAKARVREKQLTLADAANILRDEEKDVLLRTVLDWARDDDRLRERLLLYAARRSGPDTGVAAALRAFERAVRVHGFIHYREASGWASGVDDAIDCFAQLLEDGQASAVVELCESALMKLDATTGAIDDSDGHLTTLRDRLQDIHFQACEEARPDSVALARRLFEYELHSEMDLFFAAAENYAKILGAKGLKEYRRLAEAEWEKVSVRTAKDERLEWGRHFRITHAMESLARVSGDVEQLVSVIGRDLSHAYNYLRIAQVYREAGRHDHALEWAEKGLKAFPERTDGRLREFAAEEYHRRRRHGEAMNLAWAEFCERPYLETYRLLEGHAKKAKQWPEWRERALAEIRRRIAKAKEESRGQARHRWMRAGDDHSQLVEISLYEGDTEAAWREAQTGGCSDGLWLRLAESVENTHPEESARIYLKQAEQAVLEVRNSRYEEPVGLLAKAASVMKRIGRSDEFEGLLESLRQKYKIKRNFIKLLDQKEKLLYLR